MRETERARERKSVRDSCLLAASHTCPDRKSNPQPLGVWDDVPTN